MTTHEAIAAMNAVDPSRTFCARKDLWSYPGNPEIREVYTISFQPGIAAECSTFDGGTLEECVGKASDALNGITRTSNNRE